MAVVVVAEVDADLRQLLVRGFVRAGYDVIAAADGPTALAAARHPGVRAVVVNACLPVLSGAQSCRRLRSEAYDRDLFIVAYSADIRDTVRDSMYAAGADLYLTQPFRLHELTGPVLATIPPMESTVDARVAPWLAADLAGRAALGYALDTAVPTRTEATA